MRLKQKYKVCKSGKFLELEIPRKWEVFWRWKPYGIRNVYEYGNFKELGSFLGMEISRKQKLVRI